MPIGEKSCSRARTRRTANLDDGDRRIQTNERSRQRGRKQQTQSFIAHIATGHPKQAWRRTMATNQHYEIGILADQSGVGSTSAVENFGILGVMKSEIAQSNRLQSECLS